MAEEGFKRMLAAIFSADAVEHSDLMRISYSRNNYACELRLSRFEALYSNPNMIDDLLRYFPVWIRSSRFGGKAIMS